MSRVKAQDEKKGQTDRGGNLHSVRRLSAQPSLNYTYQYSCCLVIKEHLLSGKHLKWRPGEEGMEEGKKEDEVT